MQSIFFNILIVKDLLNIFLTNHDSRDTSDKFLSNFDISNK